MSEEKKTEFLEDLRAWLWDQKVPGTVFIAIMKKAESGIARQTDGVGAC